MYLHKKGGSVAVKNVDRNDPELFRKIANFWSSQLNNEIFLREFPDVVRGSREYFDIILEARRRFIYYLSDMLNYFKSAPSKSLLEVGCGMGTDSLILAQNGLQVTGMDLAQAHLHLAKQLFDLYGENGHFVEGNAEYLPFPSESFGGVYSFGVLHHTPHTATAIHEIYRVLQPGGRAVIMLYNWWSLNNLAHAITRRGFENARKIDDSDNDAPVTQRFSRKQVRQMCSMFSDCRIRIEYLYGAGWGKIYEMTPKTIYHLLSKSIGWHLVIYLTK